MRNLMLGDVYLDKIYLCRGGNFYFLYDVKNEM